MCCSAQQTTHTVEASGLDCGTLTEVDWDFVADDPSRAIDLSANATHFGTREHELLGLLAHEAARDSACLRQAHHQVHVVVEGYLSGC